MKKNHHTRLSGSHLLLSLVRFGLFILIGFQISCAQRNGNNAREKDLTVYWDTIRPIANPDKGWYHHLLDNGVGKYLVQDDVDLHNFPGMDHLYLRLAWAFLEPEEGKYDWSYIDDVVEKYVPMGYGVSFRISCKETGPAPTSVPYEKDGVRYATPYWVVQAGAKGIERPEYGPDSWCPDWDDPVFLEKLGNFHQAFANRYDGKPWIRYVDVGSIGDWGEGHTWSSTRIPVTLEEIKIHMNLYLKYYKHSQLVVTDDLLYNVKSPEDLKALLEYTLQNGITLRDDSPLVAGNVENLMDTWTVRSPEFFEAAYTSMPTIFELEHYRKVKANGNWIGQNGKGVIPELGVSGAEVFRNAMELIHPTYIGFHGYLGDWLDDNPNLTNELLNICGYWYFPASIRTSPGKKDLLNFKIKWLNKGLAPAYSVYQLKGKLIPDDPAMETIEFEIQDSGNKHWMPGEYCKEDYAVRLMEKPAGSYQFAIQLFDRVSGRPVDLGLSQSIRETDYYILQQLKF